MAISIDSRIWLATHLLYPNSSQAFDVYQSLMTQSEDSIRKNNIKYIFRKLDQIVEKIPAVSSNKAFHVFEVDQIEQWQQIYKRSQKDQLIIFVGYFIFGLNLPEIASALKLTNERTQFLFHQVFKKTIFTNIKIEVPEKIKFKKYDEEKVSFLFTSESLVDYSLKQLSPRDMKKVRIGLELYPDLQVSNKQYESIVQQIEHLIAFQSKQVTKPLIQISKPLSTAKEPLYIEIIFSRHKSLASLVGLSFVLLIFVISRPAWIQQLTESKKDHSVTLQEVKPKQVVIDEVSSLPTETDHTKVTAAATKETKLTEDIPREKVPIKTSLDINFPKTAAIILPAPPTKSMASPPSHVNDLVATVTKKSGGLFRGVLTVTDINEVTPKITERIVDIGGRKAGEVELGWKKTDKLFYYHFTLPETNVDAMKEFLVKFGSLQMQFENHPRLMPAGVKRLIIEVQERE